MEVPTLEHQEYPHYRVGTEDTFAMGALYLSLDLWSHRKVVLQYDRVK